MTCNPAISSCSPSPVLVSTAATTPAVCSAPEPVACVAPAPVDTVASGPLVCSAPDSRTGAQSAPALRPPAAGCAITTGPRHDIGTVRRVTPSIRAALGFDPRNEASVRELQAVLNVPQTGQMDLATRRELNRSVRAIQTVMLNNGVCATGAVDGILGPRTTAAMASFFGPQHSVLGILRQLQSTHG